jgi:putative membrane protein
MVLYRNIKYKSIVLSFFIVLFIVSCLSPVYPSEMFLQHSITIVMVILLAYVTSRNSLSDRSFTLIVVFMVFHLIGARWIYSYVPYDDWIRAIFGSSLNGMFGFNRNQYDRFVHLMFGLMIFPPIKEIYAKWFKAPLKLAGLLSFLTILGFSLIYEVFEWGLTLVLSPEDAEDYNGQQGDMWDAQKDMALAMAGALISLIISLIYRKKERW